MKKVPSRTDDIENGASSAPSVYQFEAALQGVRFHSTADKQRCFLAFDQFLRTQTAAIAGAIADHSLESANEFRAEIFRLRNTIRQMASRHAQDLIDREMSQDASHASTKIVGQMGTGGARLGN